MSFALALLGNVGALARRVPIWAWVAIAVVAFGGIQTARLGHAQHALTEARADVLTAQGNATRAAKLVDTQNAALTAYRAAREVDAAALALALADARHTAVTYQAKADRLTVYTPKGDDTLAQLVDLDKEIGQ